jgi:hypothetical protein
MNAEYRASRAEAIKVAVSWLVVGIPAAWGIAQTVIKVAGLFRR